jgi:hypothetical protein
LNSEKEEEYRKPSISLFICSIATILKVQEKRRDEKKGRHTSIKNIVDVSLDMCVS